MSIYLHSWAGRGVIDVPLQQVAEFLKHTENNITWDKYLVVSISLIVVYNLCAITISFLGSQYYEDSLS